MAYISFQPHDYFNTVLYTGNASTNAVTGVGFQPDWLWVKSRSRTDNHVLIDALRGTNRIRSNTTDAQADVSGDGFTSLDSDGFTLNGSGGGGEFNANSATFASWNWKANGQGSANNDGSTNTTYTSANTTAGISIVKWTPSGSAETVGHGLGAVPKMIITKNLGASQGWFTYHHSIGNGKYLLLNTTAAEATDSSAWNNTTPTSSVFSVGSQFGGSPYVAYCFAEKIGFSKFGLYEGSGNGNGPFVYTGFKPAFVLLKGKGNTESWTLYDNKINPYNEVDTILFANLSQAEQSGGDMDFLSNGFKLRGTDGRSNASGQGYIYMAFAEEPLVSSNGIPATAR